MSFDPAKFIDIARELEAGTKEEHYRSKINRAYYASFGFVKAKYPSLGSGKDVHKKAIEKLKSSPDTKKQKAGSLLLSLFKLRKQADYEYDLCIDDRHCKFAIRDAESIIDALK